MVEAIFLKKTSCSPNLSPAILSNQETSVTGEPAVSTGFKAGFLPVMVGTGDFSITGNPAVLPYMLTEGTLILSVMVGTADFSVTGKALAGSLCDHNWQSE